MALLGSSDSSTIPITLQPPLPQSFRRPMLPRPLLLPRASPALATILQGTSHHGLSGLSRQQPDGRHVVFNHRWKPSLNFWLFNPMSGFDLTHSFSPDGPPVASHFTLQTITMPVTIAPEKTAFIIVDM
ncbi:hypothetical protein EDB81DRAFT_881555 [Dactylonectria macrodidyma]|uniref:Uncharacterized protein n=1 Tax=Dactylonectria macrodidyma TaxID=307937 RepID=A0A9P9F5C2_9HYPO|nr:hypothetical protein EDB81DRAFT_881555 [Dactylonectria macrodidyma]